MKTLKVKTRVLVVAVKTSTLRETHVWIQEGRGWILDALGAGWTPLTEAPGLGGRVVTDADELARLVERNGVPA